MTTFDLLRAHGVLSEIDCHFAGAVGRIGGDERPAVQLAAALASRAVGQGHVCLDLPQLVNGAPLADEAGVPIESDWPPLTEWMSTLRASALVAPATAEAVTPLVLEDAGRLYLRRYWEHQTRLVEGISVRAKGEGARVDNACLAEGLTRLFETDGHTRADDQRLAALIAVLRRFCVISGGPGTGKTYTVLRILALLVEQALAAGAPAPRVLLLAPTGKAAARLTESIRAGKPHLACDAAVIAAIPEEAATIHRGLGAMPDRSTYYRHGPEHPLPADVVIVDEASMVDVALMARLIAALPCEARLILLGDQDQLASVEAGAVLGDICNSGAPRVFSRRFGERVKSLLGTEPASALPVAKDAMPSGITDCVVQLEHNYRYRSDSGIGRLARAITAGDSDAALAAMAASESVGRMDPAPDGTLNAALQRLVREGCTSYFDCSDPLLRLRALERFRVLCAHRRGPFGVETMNALIERLLADDGKIRPDGQFYVGRPILITRNDYQLRLFNGDVGTISADPQRPGGRVAVFVGADGMPRRLAPSRLPPHETVFAMSVHKSQGSEFDSVVVLLPDQPSPVVTRELLYTAVTRARQHAIVCASPSMLQHAVAQRTQRASGLREALWGNGS
jgi:exodeoxyribonuclease V alpha subunit